PTLAALLGFRIARSPDSYRYLRYRYPYSWNEVESACAQPDAYWIHPIARRHDDPLRVAIRARLAPIAVAAPVAVAEPPRPAALDEIRQPILTAMRQVSGWLGDDEADLLITATDQALSGCADARALVEVGSFRGKATTVIASVIRAMRPGARV